LNGARRRYLVDRANLMLFVEHGRGGKRLLSVHEAQELMVRRVYIFTCRRGRAVVCRRAA
jgi:hypothetical protein